MDATIDHQGREAGVSATPLVAGSASSADARCTPSPNRNTEEAPLSATAPSVGIATGLVATAIAWLAGTSTTALATAALPTTALEATVLATTTLATTALPISALPTPAASAWSVLPQPAEMRPAPSGVVTIADGTQVAVAVRGADRQQVQSIADRFRELVANTRRLRLDAASTVEGHTAGIAAIAATDGPSAEIDEGHAATDGHAGGTGKGPSARAVGGHAVITFEVEPDASVVGDSGYRIVVGGQGVRVIARSPAGAFYGGVTLWQLLTPPGWSRVSAAAEIAAGVIDDHPRFAWRALLLDSGRHFQSVADIEKLIDWMSLEKLNVLLWHLTEDQGWRLEIPKYPALTTTGACRKAVGLDVELTGATNKPYCGFYTEAEVREIVRYAAARFVTIVPEFDLPGHSQAAVAAYPWLGVTGERPSVWTDWGVSPWLLKPDERTLQFVDDVLDEMMKLFPSRYISIGGDEADKRQWSASPELREQMRRLGLANMDQLQGWFTNQVADHLIQHGRTPVGWDDELVAGAKLPASEVVMSWHGSDEEHVAPAEGSLPPGDSLASGSVVHGDSLANRSVVASRSVVPTGDSLASRSVALEAAAQGHEVVLTPQESLYFDHYQSDLPDEWSGQPPMTTLRQAYDTAVVPSGATAAEASRIIGVQGDLWTEFMLSFAQDQHAVYPRIAALSELGWSGASAHDWNSFLHRLSAELARYRALGIGYADSAFAPAFNVTASGKGTLRVALSNQADFGEIRYTTDGSAPTLTSTQYARPLEFSDKTTVTLRAATFEPSGFELAAPRTQVLDGSTLLSRDGSELASCSNQPAMRLAGRQLTRGQPASDLPSAPDLSASSSQRGQALQSAPGLQSAQRGGPVYKLTLGDMCWLWHGVPLEGVEQVTMTVDRVAWRFSDDAEGAVVRPKTSAAGEFELHADSCTGPLLARLPLTPAMSRGGQTELEATVSTSQLNDTRDLCIFATGDPRNGQWVLARVRFSK